MFEKHGLALSDDIMAFTCPIPNGCYLALCKLFRFEIFEMVSCFNAEQKSKTKQFKKEEETEGALHSDQKLFSVITLR